MKARVDNATKNWVKIFSVKNLDFFKDFFLRKNNPKIHFSMHILVEFYSTTGKIYLTYIVIVLLKTYTSYTYTFILIYIVVQQIYRTFFPWKIEILYLLNTNLSSSSPLPLVTTLLLSV